MNENINKAKILASSMAATLDMLYDFNVLCTGNSYEDLEKSNGTIFILQVAAERLSEIVEELQ